MTWESEWQRESVCSDIEGVMQGSQIDGHGDKMTIKATVPFKVCKLDRCLSAVIVRTPH